jgi:lipoate-protein ligase A
MALDESLAASVRRHDCPPTLRFYGWDRPSLSLGCFQKISSIDLDYCRAGKIPVVRRLTGGRAILHGAELTCSISARTDKEPFSQSLMDSFHSISKAFNLAFLKIGIRVESKMQREKGRVLSKSPLCFESSSYGEVLLNNRKIVGSAQKRWQEGLLQQVSIPYAYDKEKMQHIFGRAESLKWADCMTALKEIMTDFDEKKFKEAVCEAFEEIFEISLQASHPEPDEELPALALEQQKYLQDSWNLRL